MESRHYYECWLPVPCSLFNPLTAVGTLGTKFSKPHYYSGIGPFLNPIDYFDYRNVKLFFSEDILVFWLPTT